MNRLRWLLIGVLAYLLSRSVPLAVASETPPKVYVLLWFDTEDYLLPADDDAALRLADFLSAQNIRATFKIVGEKARVLERRGRADVIQSLARHEIGYHSNLHSVQPSPAMYLSSLGWDEGVVEFDRRERAGYDDVARIFGQTPSCYGQPGSSWGPQAFGALKSWGVNVYLDAGSHLQLDDRPHYYGGLLTLYHLAHTLRVELDGTDVRGAEARFVEARQTLLDEGGGVVSVFYHPCEFVHQDFWDAVNFKGGANPPREKWKMPPAATPEASRTAYATFENYVRFMDGFADVEFITASDAAKLYHDRALEHEFTVSELQAVARQVTSEVTFQRDAALALAASEIFALLNRYVATRSSGESLATVKLSATPAGPSEAMPALKTPLQVDLNQFLRTVSDVQGVLDRHQRIPTTVWVGSTSVPPESYLPALAEVALDLLSNEPPHDRIEIRPAQLTAANYVSVDKPDLWSWIIFPPGFRAPAMMELAKRQAWTLKPAILDRTVVVRP